MKKKNNKIGKYMKININTLKLFYCMILIWNFIKNEEFLKFFNIVLIEKKSDVKEFSVHSYS